MPMASRRSVDCPAHLLVDHLVRPALTGGSETAERQRRRAYADRVKEALLRRPIAAVAPGTALREGLERILRGQTR